MTSLFADVVSC